MVICASYGLTESEFEKVAGLPALVGKQLPFVPEHSLSLVLGHKLDNGLSYQVGSRTTGKNIFQIIPDPTQKMLLNLIHYLKLREVDIPLMIEL